MSRPPDSNGVRRGARDPRKYVTYNTRNMERKLLDELREERRRRTVALRRRVTLEGLLNEAVDAGMEAVCARTDEIERGEGN